MKKINHSVKRIKKVKKVKKIENFRKMLDEAERDAGNKTAFVYSENDKIKEVTYKEFNFDTKALGAALREMGVSSGHIAIVSENSYRFVTVFLTCLSEGGVFVPVDRELPFEEIVNILSESDADVVFYSKKFEKKMKDAMEMLPFVKYFVGLDMKDFEESDEDILSYDGLLKKGMKACRGEVACNTQSVRDIGKMRMLVYTSGTMGNAKGVMLSERNLISALYHGLEIVNFEGRGLSVLPYSHIYGALCDILASIYKRNTLCICTDMRRVMSDFKRYKPDYIFAVPGLADIFRKKILKALEEKEMLTRFELLCKISAILKKMGIDRTEEYFSSIRECFGGRLKYIFSGGAPIKRETMEFFSAIGIEIINGYGLTECSSLVSVNKKMINDTECAGFILSCVECKIDTPDKEGEGEICIRGDNVMMGYYKNDIATESVIDERGWFHTGDLGRLGHGGRLYLTGRKKNLIVFPSGKKVHPEELERYLVDNILYVEEALVRGKQEEKGGDVRIIAEIYLDPRATLKHGRDRVIRAVKRKVEKQNAGLPVYKSIHSVIVKKGEFSKTTSGKIRRK